MSEMTVVSDAMEKLKGLGSSSSYSGTDTALTIIPSPETNNKNKKEVEAMVDINKLSDSEVIQLLKQKELKKQQDRYMKQLAKGKDVNKEHKFWNTQPMPGLKEVFQGEEGPMDGNIDVSAVRKEPYNMPAGFEWCSLDINDPTTIQELYILLCENYVEDDDCLFRFDYSVAFLQWALTPPKFLKDWHVGVRNTKTGVMHRYNMILLNK